MRVYLRTIDGAYVCELRYRCAYMIDKMTRNRKVNLKHFEPQLYHVYDIWKYFLQFVYFIVLQNNVMCIGIWIVRTGLIGPIYWMHVKRTALQHKHPRESNL